ncbi:MAG TPA: 5-formyltetrahydrofolate cyclo-ligase [Chthoniobacteraceae bacterium]|jgi:5-formyltetrahydrofolate cyclo-ligase|nr:5-formyltetrahydrofolate cyclo-ligase [Phycisphaerae bacterium]HWB58778.1 5-formyltetrahydrofolate cyclo-ligase [Chthoniobacteraceae bacterium]
MTKNHLRAQMKTFLAALSANERHIRSLAACQQLIATREFRHAQTIMIFMSTPMEVETSTLAVKAWQEGKSIAVPRVDWTSKRMDPVEIKSLDTGMQTTGPGILEPVSGIVVPLGMIDMVVVPGMAFDHKGYRVGRGRGFYDRFLAQQDFQGVRCALCFHEQLVAEPLPCEAHDVPMDLIVTDMEVVRCHSTGHTPGKPTGGH